MAGPRFEFVAVFRPVGRVAFLGHRWHLTQVYFRAHGSCLKGKHSQPPM